MKEVKKPFERGEKTEIIARLAQEHLKKKITCTIKELCTAVQRRIVTEKIAIEENITPSVLKPILFAEKRPFSILRVPGEEMMIAYEKEVLLDLVTEMSSRWNKRSGKVVNIMSAPSLKKTA